MKVNLLIARFPYGGREHPDVSDWLLQTGSKIKRDSRIDQVYLTRLDDTPITMTRNATIEAAKKFGVDYVLMVDSDMAPDLGGPGAKPFWDTSFDFALAHRDEPVVIAAPYVGPPPHCNVYVFRWNNFMNDCPNPDKKLSQFSRSEVEGLTGIQEVAALPTGLILIDMRALKAIKPPYFYYEWEDETESRKASTEDVTFTRDLSIAGVRIFCNWDAWAGHWKAYRGDKPASPRIDNIRTKFSDEIITRLLADRNKGAACAADFVVENKPELPPGAES